MWQWANFTYVEGVLSDATILELCRLRYVGSAYHWRLAIHRASHDCANSVFPTASPVGTRDDALGTACGPYRNDLTA